MDSRSTYLSERYGSRADLDLRGVTLSIAAELGEDAFRDLDPSAQPRVDDVLGVSMALSFDLFKVFRFRMGVNHNDYDSNLIGFDRDVTLWTATLQLLREDLGFGRPDRIW